MTNRDSIRLLVYTTLYPNDAMPQHGIFVEQRLLNLLSRNSVDADVIAPVPWFPSKSRLFGSYSAFAAVPAESNRHDVSVAHPRYPVLPKIGMSISPILLALGTLFSVRDHVKLDRVDVIDAHYFYPDGVAATLLGKIFRKPVVITARGTDINLIPKYTLPRAWIRWAARNCSQMISVSESLRQQLISLGVDSNKVITLRNGVDLELFRPLPDRNRLRADMRIKSFTLLSVGQLIERKGHHLVLRALARLPDVALLIVGTGPMARQLQGLADELRVSERVTWVGQLDHAELVEYYNVADALVLASSREGMANVLLESLGCGTPVVATPYWGSPEVVTEPAAGQLTADRSVEAIVDAIDRLRSAYPDRDDTRKHAESFSWDATSDGLLKTFRRVTS